MSILNEIFKEHEILESFNGKSTKRGKFANHEKNEYWLVRNKKTGEEYYMMDVSNNRLTKFDKDKLEKILSIDKIWTVCNNYVVVEYERNKKIAMHAFLMDHSGNGKEQGALSVDHINQDKMDNRIINLRITTQSVQNSNRPYKKNEDSKYYTNRPPEMEEIQLPRYVEYYTEYRDSKNMTGFREFFTLTHPKCPAYGKKNKIVSSKSTSMSALEKYNFIMDKMKEYEIEIMYC